MECIILAGGLGTRLRGVIGNQPKCMAPVNGRPFLDYLLEYLAAQQCTKVILSLGYAHDVVIKWLEENYNHQLPVEWVIETTPLGTGGGIKLALEAAKDENVLVLNGDTMFQVPLQELLQFHLDLNAETSLALKPMEHFERYGVVRINEANQITGFEEKKYQESGLINGGIYTINRNKFLAKNWPEKFSFEKDYLEHDVVEKVFFGYESKAYFIDIGIPEDYEKAQADFKEIFK